MESGESEVAGATRTEPVEEDWSFECQPLNLLFGEPPSFHGSPEQPYSYPWPKASRFANQPPIGLCLPDSDVSLMAHHVWEAGIKLSDQIAIGAIDVTNKSVLELGAGSAIPSIVALHMGARWALVTDYPDPSILQTIEANMALNAGQHAARRLVLGHKWGDNTDDLIEALRKRNRSDGLEDGDGFDVVLVGDCLYWADLHRPLLETCSRCVRRSGVGRVVLSFQYHNRAPDAFLALAEQEYDFQVRLLQRIQLSWGSLVDIEYEPELHEPDGIGFIRGPIYIYEMLLT